jgi:hypothetical protein
MSTSTYPAILKYIHFENLMKKRETTPKWVIGFTSKLQGV